MRRCHNHNQVPVRCREIGSWGPFQKEDENKKLGSCEHKCWSLDSTGLASSNELNLDLWKYFLIFRLAFRCIEILQDSCGRAIERSSNRWSARLKGYMAGKIYNNAWLCFRSLPSTLLFAVYCFIEFGILLFILHTWCHLSPLISVFYSLILSMFLSPSPLQSSPNCQYP